MSERGSIAIEGPGNTEIAVAIGEAHIVMPIRVVELPFKSYVSKADLALAMGFPDAVKEMYSTELWYWNKYPDMCVQVTSTGFSAIYSSWGGWFENMWKE